MKNKGFTLMELLGVIIILSVLILITFPIILNQVRNAKQEIKDSTKVLIIDAAKDYYDNNMNNYETYEGITYCININTLSEQGYLNKKIKDENLNDINTSKNVKLVYHNAKFDYDIVDSCQTYTVTFDANGGIVDIDSKEFIVGSVYGSLPTPTKEGYTFMGWNGKNLFYLSGRIEKDPGGTFSNTSIRNFSGDGIYKGITANNYYNSTNANIEKIDDLNNTVIVESKGSGYGIGFDFRVEPNTKYTVSVLNPASIRIGEYEEDGTWIKWNQPSGTMLNETITTSNQTYWLLIVSATNANMTSEYINIQLEEGDTATEYEPYFIKENTKIVQNNNHTLKAIWKANE